MVNLTSPVNGMNPYAVAREVDDTLLARLGPIVSEHMKGVKSFDEFKRLMTTNSVLSVEEIQQRVRGNAMLQLAEGTALQARIALEGFCKQRGITKAKFEAAMANEDLASGINQLSDVVTWTTQMLHLSLSIFPKLYAQQLCSVQPMNSPTANVFYLTKRDDNGNDLSDLDTFNANLSADPGEGQQIRKVKHKITSDSVSIEYHKLMRETSWESEVKMASQFNMSMGSMDDALLGQQMLWDIDRIVINRLLAFASATYTFDQTKGGTYNSLVPTEQEAWDRNFMRRTWNDAKTDFQALIYRAPNWCLAGTEVCKFLGRQKGLWETVKSGDPNFADTTIGNGEIAFAGRYDDINVWHDPQMDHCTALVGHTDQMNPFYAGFIFSPFGLASLLTAAFRDPNNLLERRAQAMAFATKGVRSEQYIKIKLGSCS